MLKLLTEKELPDFVKQHCKKRPVRLAVAFWGAGATARLGLSEADGGRIICNLESGCCNPEEIKKLKGRFDLKTHSKLHGKVYSFLKTDQAQAVAVVGSSNASLNGLALEGEIKGWRELNVAFSSEDTLAELDKWFDRMWDEGDDVQNADLEKAALAWKRRQAQSIPRPTSKSIIQAAIEKPAYFYGKPIYFIIYRANLDREEIQAISADVEAGKFSDVIAKTTKYEMFRGWDKFPKDSWFIEVGFIKKPRCYGILRSIDKAQRCKDDDGVYVELLFKRTKIELGEVIFDLSAEDKEIILTSTERLWEKNTEGADCYGVVVSLDKAIDILRESASR